MAEYCPRPASYPDHYPLDYVQPDVIRPSPYASASSIAIMSSRRGGKTQAQFREAVSLIIEQAAILAGKKADASRTTACIGGPAGGRMDFGALLRDVAAGLFSEHVAIWKSQGVRLVERMDVSFHAMAEALDRQRGFKPDLPTVYYRAEFIPEKAE